MRKLRRIGTGEDDPLDGVANFFDLGVIFALGFMVPLLAKQAQKELTRPPAPSAETASAQAPPAPSRVRVPHYRPSADRLAGDGQRLGVAYRLASGEVVYVPDGAATPPTNPKQ